MTSSPSNPSRPEKKPGTESQPEYIRRLDARLQQISRLAETGARVQQAGEIDIIGGELLAAVREAVPDAEVRLYLREGESLRDAEAAHRFDGIGQRGEIVGDDLGVADRAMREHRTIWVGACPDGGIHVLAAIPLPVDAEPIGVLALRADRSLEPPDPAVLSGIETLGRHASSAIERLRAAQRAGQRRIYLDTLVEIDREILGATRLNEVIRFALRTAVERTGAAWGVAWLYDASAERLRLSSTFGGGSPEFDAQLARMGEQALRALRSHGPVSGADPETGASFLCAPMIAFDEPLGALAVGEPRGGRAFGGDEEAFLRTIASQCALATQNAHLCDRERDAMRRLQETQGMLMQTERLAALGELSAKVAHEIRNPLSAIGGFARRIEKALPETDPNASYAAIITREIRRLETILTEQLEFARSPQPRLVMIDLNDVVRETMTLIREETEKIGVELLEAYESRIPPMLLDADRVKQVLLNILKNAAASTRKGQRIRVRTRASEGWAQIEIANDGERLAGEILEQLFVPFATGRNQGCGLGLAVADQIVKEHGGEIRVRSDEEWSVVFTVSLPIRQNQDKRRNPQRRRGRDRRWAA
jgi:signal transduction histidine kinase